MCPYLVIVGNAQRADESNGFGNFAKKMQILQKSV
jgi:hypothetical protein